MSKYQQPVRHRIDGLEKTQSPRQSSMTVRHRIDGLEIFWFACCSNEPVRHRIDGLETISKTAIFN